MGYARKNLVSLQDTPYDHCIARCVRRAWLWTKQEVIDRWTVLFRAPTLVQRWQKEVPGTRFRISGNFHEHREGHLS